MENKFGPANYYEVALQDARKLYAKSADECIAAAKKNLADETLPSYYVMKNCIIIASATVDLREMQIWAFSAEHVFKKVLSHARKNKDVTSLKLLLQDRHELVHLQACAHDCLAWYARQEMAAAGVHHEEWEMVEDAAYGGEVDEVAGDQVANTVETRIQAELFLEMEHTQTPFMKMERASQSFVQQEDLYKPVINDEVAGEDMVMVKMVYEDRFE